MSPSHLAIADIDRAESQLYEVPMPTRQEVLRMLETSSRSYYLPIAKLPGGYQEAVASAYLCFRAIDEIEDHPTLEKVHKIALLRQVSLVLQEQMGDEPFPGTSLAEVYREHRDSLAEVTLRLGEWARFAPPMVAPLIWDSVSAMAARMAYWVERDWIIATRRDLDRYTYAVASAVGLVLCDLAAWHDGVQFDRATIVGFSRGMQAVNFMRNRSEDLDRGRVDFFPDGWGMDRMAAYARSNLDRYDAFDEGDRKSVLRRLVKMPRALGYATLDAVARGQEDLSREEFLEVARQTGHL